MNAAIVSLSFLFGAAIGSFLDVVILRLHAGRTLLGYSECPHCHRRLRPQDLVPILSFLFLGARCRYCRHLLSWQYPVVEFACGAAFALVALQQAPDFASLRSFVMLALGFFNASLLIVIFTFDWKYYLIPDRLVGAGIVVALVLRLVTGSASPLDGLYGAAIMSGLFGGLFLLSQGRWIGLGDVKLGLYLGLLVGLSGSLMVLFFAYTSGAIVGVALIMSGRKTMRGVLPFGTFITLASFVVMLWGEKILEWYRLNLYL